MVGGVGVCKCRGGLIELDAEAPGTYPRGALTLSFSGVVAT